MQLMLLILVSSIMDLFAGVAATCPLKLNLMYAIKLASVKKTETKISAVTSS
jgi:hypothetical protein